MQKTGWSTAWDQQNKSAEDGKPVSVTYRSRSLAICSRVRQGVFIKL
ncbi:hypothetical protein [Kribbella sp. NPDC023855]